MKKLIIAGMFVFLVPFILPAQSFLLENWPSPRSGVTLQYYRPNFKDQQNLTSLSGIYTFTLSIPMRNRLNLVGTIPYGSLSYGGPFRETGSGNIYLGLQYRLRASRKTGITMSTGVFLPTLRDNGSAIGYTGFFTNYFQFPAFYLKHLTFYGNFALRRIIGNDFMVGIEAGPYVAIPTEKSAGDKTDVFLHYGLFSAYRFFEQFTFKVELAGVGIISREAGSLNDRFVHELAFGILWNSGVFRPGIFYKIFLDKEFRDEFGGVFGVRLELMFR